MGLFSFSSWPGPRKQASEGQGALEEGERASFIR